MVEINNQTKNKINSKLLKAVAEKFLVYYKVSKKEVSIAIVTDSTIKKINEQYRHQAKVTDVLSFVGEGDFLGEIVIDYAQIKRQAKEFNRKINDELIFILVHGLLHLIGYNDETEKDRLNMVKLGENFINLKCKNQKSK